MTTKVVWKNPQTRLLFNRILIMVFTITLWGLIFAFLFGGGFWWGFLLGGCSVLAIYCLGEFSGAYDEKIVVIEDDAADKD